jgi:tripartite ATP-independent transporter DctP family solute receptor
MSMVTLGHNSCRAAGLALAMTFAAGTLTGVHAQPKIEATLSSPNSKGFSIVKLETLFAQKVREKTHDGLVITIVGDAQLGGMKENIEAVMGGNLEMCQVNNAFLGSVFAKTALFDLPFLFRDNDHMRHVVRGPIGQGVYAEFEKATGVRLILTGIADGPRSVWNRTKPITTPADLKGMKLRVMESSIMVDTFKALGALPVPMAFPAIYMTVKQGVIDGAETPPNGLADMKAPEIAKYYSLTRHFGSPSAVAVNAKWLTSLPAEYQTAIQQAQDEAMVWYDGQYDTDARDSLEAAKKAGMEVNDITDLTPFHDAMKPVYEKYAARVGGQQAIQAVLDTK